MTPRNPLLEGLLSTDLDTADLVDGVDDDVLVYLLQEFGNLPPAAPPPGLRDRVLDAASPYRSFADRIGALFEVGADTVREYLALLGKPEVWHGFLPGCELLHVEGGPALRGADVGFVRVADGCVFPHHGHGGEERSLVMAGTLVDSDGVRHEPGELVIKGAGTEHHFRAEGEVLFAVVVWGVDFGEELQGRLHS